MLVRPVNLFVQATTRPRYFMGIGDVVLALGVFVPAVYYAPVHWTVLKVFLCAAFILSGALIEASVWVVVSALAFRFTTSAQIGQLSDGAITTLSSYPLSIFGPDAQRTLTIGIPIAFIAYLGTSLLLGKTSHLVVPAWTAYLAPAVGATLFALAYWFWVAQARHYQSTGSGTGG
jgi:ABC-2 type transport system permease protein